MLLQDHSPGQAVKRAHARAWCCQPGYIGRRSTRGFGRFAAAAARQAAPAAACVGAANGGGGARSARSAPATAAAAASSGAAAAAPLAHGCSRGGGGGRRACRRGAPWGAGQPAGDAARHAAGNGTVNPSHSGTACLLGSTLRSQVHARCNAAPPPCPLAIPTLPPGARRASRQLPRR